MLRVLVVSLLSVPVTFAASQSRRTIEDKDLSPASSAAEKVIRTHPQGREYADCRFEGAPLKAPDGTEKELFVTTSDVCAWGAAQGPILILKEENGAFSVLLHTVGYFAETVSAEGQQHHGLRVHGAHSTTEYRFNAGHYVKVKTTVDR